MMQLPPWRSSVQNSKRAMLLIVYQRPFLPLGMEILVRPGALLSARLPSRILTRHHKRSSCPTLAPRGPRARSLVVRLVLHTPVWIHFLPWLETAGPATSQRLSCP